MKHYQYVFIACLVAFIAIGAGCNKKSTNNTVTYDDSYFISKYDHTNLQQFDSNHNLVNTPLPTASIQKCTYHDTTVYVVNPIGSDMTNDVYSSEDRKLCLLGGFGGDFEGKCKDFDYRTCTTIWSKSS